MERYITESYMEKCNVSENAIRKVSGVYNDEN